MPHATSGNSLGRMAAGAALGLVAGLALPHARKLVMQGPSLAAGDWTDALKAEHRVVEKLFQQLLNTSERDQVKREFLLTKIGYALNKHAIEEENVIYPALSESDYATPARQLAEEHQEAKTYLYDLRRISSADPNWLVTAREFWARLEQHMREEEEDVFPAFHAALSPRENAELTAMMNWEGLKVA